MGAAVKLWRFSKQYQRAIKVHKAAQAADYRLLLGSPAAVEQMNQESDLEPECRSSTIPALANYEMDPEFGK